jgi:hypothetical protein
MTPRAFVRRTAKIDVIRRMASPSGITWRSRT